MCNCINIEPQSKECYAQMVSFDIPDHMHAYRSNRVKAGLSGKVCIDPCIVVEIRGLWQNGIHTRGCCCGHNLVESMVNVAPESISKMVELGYVMNHTDKSRKDTFKLKSA